jgi:hypothetical protein
MRTLCRPLAGELLYSTFGRAAFHHGFWSPKALLDLIYGRRTVVAVPDLPSNLDAVARATQESWHLGAEELALQHTLVAYYTHFRGAHRAKKVLKEMAGDGASLQVRLGVCAGAARPPKWFHLCWRCHAEDLARYGEAIWHRAHHLPGVLVCHVHGEILVQSQVPFRPAGRHEFRAAPIEVDVSDLQPLVSSLTRSEVAKAVAVRSTDLLHAQPCARPTQPDYRSRLAQFGWAAGRGKDEKLRTAFVDYFGDDLLRASFRSREGQSLAWLCEVLRTPRRVMHPFKHVLMTVFLDGQGAPPQEPTAEIEPPSRVKTWRVYRSVQMRNEAASLAKFGLTTHAVACALEVDWKTAHRLLAPLPSSSPSGPRDSRVDRQSWEQLCAAHPLRGKKALRALAPALYARLYRNDRAWLLAWQPLEVPASATPRRVDWHERDAKTELEVREQAARALRQVPPQRVSRNRVLAALGIRALVAHRAALLPMTCAALRELSESVDAFQLRRLIHVLCRRGAHLPDWQVLRQAGIQPCRFADKGQGLLRRARECAAQMQRRGEASS